jgi:hypothetical protein
VSNAASQETTGSATTFSSFGDVAHALSAFYTTVTDGKRWRSIGWILLGLLLMFVGLAMLGIPALIRKTPASFAAKAVGNA